MSYRPLTADELGLFAAIAVHNKWLPEDGALLMAERISVENMSACLLFDNHMEPVDHKEIRSSYLDRLSKKNFATNGEKFGPFHENMLGPSPGSLAIWVNIQEIELRVMSFLRAQEAAKERAEENAVAFDGLSDLESFLEKHAPLKGTEREVRCDSIEHRENYSMGGGNYLGRSRYSGWVVKSDDISYLRNEPMEYFDPLAHKAAAISVEPTVAEIYSANV